MRNKASFLIGFLVILFVSSNSFGQNETLITPKKNVSQKIESYESIWSQIVTETNGKTRKGINTIKDTVQVNTAEDGRKTINRTVKWTDINNNWYIRTDRLDYKTLKPISIDIRWNPNYVQHTDINGKRIISTSIKNELSTNKLTMVDVKDFGYIWSSDGFILNVVGKLKNKKFALQTLNNLPHSPTISKKGFEILSNEKINIEGIGNFRTTKIKTIGGGNSIATYWLADVKPYIVKVKFVQSNGQVTVWKLDSVKYPK